VAALMERGTPVSAKPFEFIGYRELRGHLQDRKPLEEAVEAITVATRQYAKRQMTWFRKEQGVTWFAGCGDDPEIVARVLLWLEEKLRGRQGERAERPKSSDQV